MYTVFSERAGFWRYRMRKDGWKVAGERERLLAVGGGEEGEGEGGGEGGRWTRSARQSLMSRQFLDQLRRGPSFSLPRTGAHSWNTISLDPRSISATSSQ